MKNSTRNRCSPTAALYNEKVSGAIRSQCRPRNSFLVVFRLRSGAGLQPWPECLRWCCELDRAPDSTMPPGSDDNPTPDLPRRAAPPTLRVRRRCAAVQGGVGRSVVLLGDQPSMPGEQGLRRDESRQFYEELPSQTLGPRRYPSIRARE
jgi:hypothetical protein